jgi:S1-C subfamily serine protease
MMRHHAAFHAERARLEHPARGAEAERVGVHVGDVLIEYDGQPVDWLDSLPAAIAAAKQERAKLVLIREGEPLELEVKVGRLGIVMDMM